MTWYNDLSQCDYFGAEAAGRLIAVGWLDEDHPYTEGEVDAGFVERLSRLLVDPWEPAASMGRHECPFCRFSGGPASFHFCDITVHVGSTNLFVPAEGFLFVAPSMIVHYIDAHDYAPPELFQQAVNSCPKMRSAAYREALSANGPKGLVRLRPQDSEGTSPE